MPVSDDTRRKWNERIEFLGEHPTYLTDWEIDFVEDMARLVDSGVDLNFNQSKKLGQIFHYVEYKVG